jgi:hypothetical protein
MLSLLNMNDIVTKLGYGVPMDTSVVVNRTHKKYKFVHDTYSGGAGSLDGEIATCIFPTGTDYIDTRRSFLQFELTTSVIPTPGGYNINFFGVHGSVCNLIRQICIYARSGEELCRIEDFNLLSNMLLPLTYERDWFNRQGAGMWYGDRIYSTQQTCAIPMYILSPLFGYGRLLPAALVSGMRVEITLESAHKAATGVIYDDNPIIPIQPILPSNFSISNVTFSMETVKLGDSIRMAMDEIIAMTGVELVYSGWHHTFTEPGHDLQGGVELTISDSYTRALRAFARVRAFDPAMYPIEERDAFMGEHIFPIAEYQWRLGERYYPDKPVRNGNRPIIESYIHTLNAMNQWDSKRKQSLLPLLHDDTMSTITTDLYSGDPNPGVGDAYPRFIPSFPGQIGSYARGGHVIAVDLTRDSDNSMSGRPVNNVEPLTLWLKGNTNTLELLNGADTATLTVPPNRRLDMFLQYTKLVRVFANRVEIEK